MNKKIELMRVPNELYPLSFSYDVVYQLRNEHDVPIGVVFISQLPFDDEIYIEWLETLIMFHGMGYLRCIFKALTDKLQKSVQFECGEDLRIKYLSIGCEEHGISERTGNYIMSYHNK